MNDRCAICNSKASLACKECEKVYCGSKCQSLDWMKGHVQQCSLIKGQDKRPREETTQRMRVAEAMKTVNGPGDWAFIALDALYEPTYNKLRLFLSLPDDDLPFWVEYPEFWQIVSNLGAFDSRPGRSRDEPEFVNSGRSRDESDKDYVMRNLDKLLKK